MTDVDSTPALAVADLVKTFGGIRAVDGTTFSVPAGSITGLIGPNGAGKSTLFDLVTGVLTPDSGEIRLRGEDVVGRAPHEVAAAGVGRTFQTPKTFAGMSVADNLAFAATNQTGESALNALFRGKTVADEERAVAERVAETLDFLDLSHLADEYARGLSGGQRKLLELGRVLMLDPSLLMLDEPAAGVNPALTEKLLERVRALNDEGRTVLFVEHDIDLVMRECDHVVVMHNGATLATGTPEEIRANDRVVDAYLGGG
ncbi:ABC transporter ATP-binding protein [Salinigranum rubrum]|uniref:Probable branched-chain amino acid transport ATP-binding protein LivG n=1 Tax=Salinigranum rubrum TaxID=755307 RepID=A0A2I8VNU0_9EURY|nr:ABC transporter ATP-binding protein [Salinigranum rubrum]